MVSLGNDTPAYGPSIDNVHFADYPFLLSFYVVFEKIKHGADKADIGLSVGENCSQVLKENNFYALRTQCEVSFRLN